MKKLKRARTLKTISMKSNRSLNIRVDGQEVRIYAIDGGGLSVTIYTMGNTGAIKQAKCSSPSYSDVTAMDDTKYTNVTLCTSYGK